jgi:hypothetical protein
MVEMKKGEHILPNKWTLGDWLEYWFKEHADSKVKHSTKVSYDLYIYKHINPVIGHILLKDLRSDILQRFLNEKAKNGRLDGKGGLSPKTLRNMTNLLSEALDRAVFEDLMPKSRNPCKGLSIAKPVKKEINVFTVEEQKRLMEAAKTE